MNTVIGFAMELRATRAMEALQRMGKARARVNAFLCLAVLVGVGLLLAAVHVPLLAAILSVNSPGPEGWLLSLSFSLLPLVVVQLMKQAGLGWETRSGG